MGGKRTGTGKHIHLCLACLILLGSAGCAGWHPQIGQPAPLLQTLQPFIERGDYDRAARKSEEVLASHADRNRHDEALFALGLLSADVKNPRKDYRKSRDFFARLVREYPSSPLTVEARIWIGVLDLFEQSKQVDLEIEVKKKEMGK